MVKSRIEFAGILPLALAPYPREGGRYKLIVPPAFAKGIPSCQPAINPPNTKAAPVVSSAAEVNLNPLVKYPVYLTLTVEQTVGTTVPVPAVIIS